MRPRRAISRAGCAARRRRMPCASPPSNGCRRRHPGQLDAGRRDRWRPVAGHARFRAAHGRALRRLREPVAPAGIRGAGRSARCRRDRAQTALSVPRPERHRTRVLHHAAGSRHCRRSSAHARDAARTGRRRAGRIARRQSRAHPCDPAAARRARRSAAAVDRPRARHDCRVPQLSGRPGRFVSGAGVGFAVVRSARAGALGRRR